VERADGPRRKQARGRPADGGAVAVDFGPLRPERWPVARGSVVAVEVVVARACVGRPDFGEEVEHPFALSDTPDWHPCRMSVSVI
jgi:hypothetical protein